MKRFLSILSLVILGFASTACYDDAALRESIEDLDTRVEKLETLCTEMNTTISSLAKVVEALQKGDYVISVSPLEEDGVELGYRIVFKESGVVDLYHGNDGADGKDGADGVNGTNGQDGHSPVLGTKQDEDGAYYWTVDGEWVLDGEGKKIPLVTLGATPELKIENNTWYVTYDGKTWEEIGAAVAVGIKNVETVDGNLVITMAEGDPISIPLGSPLKVVLGEFDATALQVGSDLVIPYTLEGAEGDVVVFVLNDGDVFDVELVEETATSGKVTVSQTVEDTKEHAGKVGIFAVAEDGTTVSKAIRLVSGVFYEVEGNQAEYAVEGKGGKVEFKVATNGAFEVETSADWVTYVETKAVEEKTLEFEVAANEGEARTAEVTITSGDIELGFTVAQAAAAEGGEEEFVETLVGAYKIHYFWVYGGTGPEYDSAGWVDLHNKTWWFDIETGHGIAAERDNYLEFKLESVNADKTQSTGTCTNWAGVDGKNWDTWFYNNPSIKANPDAPKDGSGFYRQIPIGTSTWVRDYTVTPNTVTFTDSEGTKTTLEILEPGYKFVPGYNDSKAETNTRTFPRNVNAEDNDDLTFHAKVKGTNNWNTDRNYELDKLFYNPRDFFIDVDKVDEIPAEAKTTEEKYTPEFPEEEAPASIAGTYKFRDGATVGGKDGSITAKGLINQYGTWDGKRPDGQKFMDVINKIKNDSYEFVATGTDTNGNEMGTVTFNDGGDGTWDYLILDNTVSPYAAYDATELYGIIAHDSSTTYVYDAVAGTVTFTTRGKEYVVDFLVPGTYKYSGVDVTVPNDTEFGLHHDLGYTEPRIANYSNANNGCARHYVWARHHVFMFDKQ